MTKMTQALFDEIIRRLPQGDHLNIEELLKGGAGYEPIFEGIIINGQSLAEGVVLDLSNLVLNNVRITNMKANQVIFTNTEFNNCTVLAEQAMCNRLDEEQQENIIHLQIEKDSVFSQESLLAKYARLNPKGVCNGLCIEYARHYMKHRGQNNGINFIDKLKRKLYEKSDNFIERLHSYQEQLQTIKIRAARSTIIAVQDILNMKIHNKISRSMKNSNVVGLLFGGESRGHIVAVTLIRDDQNDITGYKIFDPNYGEINCSMGTKAENLNKFNSQLVELSFLYDMHNMSDNIYISDLENLVRTAGLDGKGDDKNLTNKVFAISADKIRVVPQRTKTTSHVKRSIDDVSHSAVERLDAKRIKVKSSQENKAL